MAVPTNAHLEDWFVRDPVERIAALEAALKIRGRSEEEEEEGETEDEEMTSNKLLCNGAAVNGDVKSRDSPVDLESDTLGGETEYGEVLEGEEELLSAATDRGGGGGAMESEMEEDEQGDVEVNRVDQRAGLLILLS